MVDVESELAGRLPFWGELSPADRQTLVSHSHERTFETGERVHDGSTDCAGVMVMLEGSLRAYILSPDTGKQITLFRVNSRDSCVLAASDLLSRITFEVLLDVTSDTHAIVIESGAFAEVMEKCPAVEAFGYRQVADRFSEVMWVMQQVLFMSFDERLAIFLLDELSRTGNRTLSLTHEQIARHLGSAREVVSRMLKYFESEGMVSLDRGSVTLVDLNRLRELATV